MRLPALFLLAPALAHAQPPPGYYDAAEGLTGEPLRAALHGIIAPHTVVLYSQLWNAFSRTDRKADNTVWDIYSDVPGGTPPYVFHFVSDQCGTYDSEGDCFNREHSFPVSWFNDAQPMNSDLFHIYPTDAWVNQQRGNWPYGTVSAPTYTSQNGGKRGPCAWPGCAGTVFEPIDAYKGDLARGYFYLLTRYMDESLTWPAPVLSGGSLLPWAESLLLAWHVQDPVSAKEQARNDSIFLIQSNRNPYIDNPQWVHSIWGPQAGVEGPDAPRARVWHDGGRLIISLPGQPGPMPVEVIDATGRTVLSGMAGGDRTFIPFEAMHGMYIARVGHVEQRIVIRFTM